MAETTVLFVLFSLLFAVTSGLEVNPDLETSIECNSTLDCYNYSESLTLAQCNDAGKCQCSWQLYPTTSGQQNSGILDQCSTKLCSLPSSCVELYRDPNSTCISAGICDCLDNFRFNETTNQCEYELPEVLKLGDVCWKDGQQVKSCGRGARCTFEGYCQCQ